MMNFINLKIKLVQFFKDIYTYIQYIYMCECLFIRPDVERLRVRHVHSLSAIQREEQAACECARPGIGRTVQISSPDVVA
jgi:hypothetical protein